MENNRLAMRYKPSYEQIEINDSTKLANGDIIVEMEGSVPKLKIGVDNTPWNQLPYINIKTWGDFGGDRNIPSSQTRYYKLNLLGTKSPVSFEALNYNFERIDTSLKSTNLRVSEFIYNQSSNTTINPDEQENPDDELVQAIYAIQREIQDARNIVGTGDNLCLADTFQTLDNEISTTNARITEVDNKVRSVDLKIDNLRDDLVNTIGKSIPDGLGYENNELYLTANGVQIGDSITIVGGGGGGGSSQTYTITLTNLLSDRNIIMAKDEECILEFDYQSVDSDGYNDGNGIGYFYNNQIEVSAAAVKQGKNSINITSFLNDGKNEFKIVVKNSEGSQKSLIYYINILTLSITTSAPSMGAYSGDTSFSYSITGAGEKTIYFIMDGQELGRENISSSGNTHEILIPAQSDGAHLFEMYAEMMSGTNVIKSNTVKIGMIFYTEESTKQSILFMEPENAKNIEQGMTLTFPYLAYDPGSPDISVSLNIYKEDGELYKTTQLVVNRAAKEWVTQDYPSGKVKFEISCRDTSVHQIIEIKESSFDKEIITSSCVLNFDARGRSNSESNPESWEYEDITADFNGFSWSEVDGWQTKNGQACLRFIPGNTMNIHYKPFDDDIRTSGYTIEAEFATHNVRDYDSVVIDSFNNGRGLSIKSQSASLASEQKSVGVQFKEDSRVRLCFVVEPSTLGKFIYVYINGILSGATQYPDLDDFQQRPAVEITIGAESCGLDLYTLRMYRRAFSRHEQLNNYICDRATLLERIEADNRNNVLNDDNQVTIADLPPQIPYMIIECEELPQSKGDKKNDKSVTYVEPLHPERNFTATGVQLDVQGTSSAKYPVKNYKVALKGGLTYTQSGLAASGFPIYKEGIEGKVICLKADFASSEQANNVCLVDYYETLTPYKTPPQLEDSRVRIAVRGFPCVVFWKNTTDNSITFLGKYNFNDDKSNEDVFGFDREKYPKCECVEFRNNTNPRVKFQISEYEEMITDENGDLVKGWLDAFEFRFPDIKPAHEDYTQLKRMTDWVASTYQGSVTNEALPSAITYPHWQSGAQTTFEIDNVDYRLSKFKAEFSNYFIKDAMTFYYLFTEVFLLVDNRAKNMFLTTFDGNHWFPIPYDMDTAIGINNEGSLSFEYDLEDYDSSSYETDENATVFNCGDSALWVNFYKVFKSDVRDMYRSLRSGNYFNYDYINNKMRSHQEVWPEAIWNEDEFIKYINNVAYLDMLQGDKEAQRDWWLFNAFKYRDSKYFTGDATKNFALIRCYAPGNITVTPYQHLHPYVEYGSTFATYGEDEGRVKRNQAVEMVNPIETDTVNDRETHIYSADRLASVGDLSHLKVGLANFSTATKLQELILGSEEEGYSNANLKELVIGNNELLTLINISNCNSSEIQPIDASGCPALETVLAEGTKLTSIKLPNGGHLKTLKLPATIRNLTIQNQKNIETFSMQGKAELSSLFLVNTPNLPVEDLILNSPSLSRVGLINMEWTASSESSLLATIEKLNSENIGGTDETGANLDKALVSGRVSVNDISLENLVKINEIFPDLIVIANGVPQYFIRYINYNKDLLYYYIAEEDSDAIDPLVTGDLEAIPTRPAEERITYSFDKWSDLPKKIRKSYSIPASYKETYMVIFYRDEEKKSILNTQWIENGKAAVDPLSKGVMPPEKLPTERYEYEFSHWEPDFTVVTSPLDIVPKFTETTRQFLVQFYNENYGTNGVIYQTKVPYGEKAEYAGPEVERIGYDGSVMSNYSFIGWEPSVDLPIEQETLFVATFMLTEEIEDDWVTIAEKVKQGRAHEYAIGEVKTLYYDFQYTNPSSGEVEIIPVDMEMEIVGINHDELTEVDSEYNGGKNTAGLTFICRKANLETKTRVQYNKTNKTENGITEQNVGGYRLSSIREYCNNDIYNSLTEEMRSIIKEVKKISDTGGPYYENVTTNEKIWIPSLRELNGNLTEDYIINQGRPYNVFTNNQSRIKGFQYYTRTTTKGTLHRYIYYIPASSGLPAYSGALNYMASVFGFCI